MTRALIVAATALVLAGPAGAQRTPRVPRPPRCAPLDTTAAWARAQASWRANSGPSVSDGAFRAALLAALPQTDGSALLLGADVAGETPVTAVPDTAIIATLRALAAGILKHMMEAGPDESPPAAVATLEDRLRLARGRKQLYATQMTRRADGTVEPLPTEDLAHVDLRREGATLPPLAVSLCAARRR